MSEQSIYQRRRRQFMDKMEGGVAIFPAGREQVRNRDVHHVFRQDSDFFYLTGFEEPESVLLLMPASDKPVTLFVPPRDPEKESWEGPRAGVEGAVRDFGADEAFPIDEVGKRVKDALKNQTKLYYALGLDPEWDQRVIEAVGYYRTRSRLGEFGPKSLVEPGDLLHSLRLRKGAEEIDLMAQAAEISAQAHCEAMRACRPGLNEAHLQSVLELVFRTNGSKRDAYPSIVATGNNATVLHYTNNCDTIDDGDLILIDAGCEYGYLASDITRCFPANGRFTNAQRGVYQVCLDAQLAAIDKCRPGNGFQDVHDRAVEVLAAGLVALGLIEGPVSAAIEEERYKKFFWHRTSHWLGMDVHDVGDYKVEGDWVRFEPGMVLTVEPGIYISNTLTDVPDEYKGIGVRIEDDVLITPEGNRVLTSGVPKEIEAIESVMAEAPHAAWPTL